MWIKTIVLLAMLAVLYNLFKGLSRLVKGGKREDSEQVLKSLIWRLVFSIAIIVGLYVASFFGLIAPHGLPKPATPAVTSPAAP